MLGLVGALALVVGAAAPAGAGPVTLDMSTLPGAPWVHQASGTVTSSVSGGVLTIDTTSRSSYLDQDPSSAWQAVDNAAGWRVKVRMRVVDAGPGGCTNTQVPLGVVAADGVAAVTVGFGPGYVCLTGPELTEVPYDTSDFHTYEIAVTGTRVVVKADHVVLIDRTLAGPGAGGKSLRFGDFNTADHSTSQWDFVTYETRAACTIVGTEGRDVINGTPGDDVICGLGGNDYIDGKMGNDTVYGASGNDALRGARGDDLLEGGDGDDLLIGNAGNDVLRGQMGLDVLRADRTSDGADVLLGGGNWDHLTYKLRDSAPVRISTDGVADDGAAGEGDNVGTDIETVVGTIFADVITHRQVRAGAVRGLLGDDLIDVTDGTDINDTIDAGGGTDTCLSDPVDARVACEG